MKAVRLNIGCGFKRRDGYVNVDSWDGCNPDALFTADVDVWPFPDSSVAGLLFEHSMEHMGETLAGFRHLIREAYRVCANGAEVEVIVPHWRHDSFAHDPTHVRVITPFTLGMLDRDRNRQARLAGDSESQLGLMWGVDFEFVQGVFVSDPAKETSPVIGFLRDGIQAGPRPMDPSAVTADMISLFGNVLQEIRMTLRIHKPARVY